MLNWYSSILKVKYKILIKTYKSKGFDTNAKYFYCVRKFIIRVTYIVFLYAVLSENNIPESGIAKS